MRADALTSGKVYVLRRHVAKGCVKVLLVAVGDGLSLPDGRRRRGGTSLPLGTEQGEGLASCGSDRPAQ